MKSFLKKCIHLIGPIMFILFLFYCCSSETGETTKETTKETMEEREEKCRLMSEKYLTEEVLPKVLEKWNSQQGIVDDISIIDISEVEFEYSEKEEYNKIKSKVHCKVYVSLKSDLLKTTKYTDDILSVLVHLYDKSEDILHSFDSNHTMNLYISVYPHAKDTKLGKWECENVIRSGEDSYGFYMDQGQYVLILNGNEIARYGEKRTPQPSGSKENSKKKCTVCNGSGTIKYNYGGSDFEAYMDGQDPYTFSQCYKCLGSGYIEE